ncbi:hypothetical protein NC99_30830 [Sunxiuqinia dokdonensis]|uniref:Uncharacterized protein n=1 Tax=Sunxiuqinia dokdonensis TaxID=1409788 RepID=A0A0L8V6I1_9BACT|nr:hypothetical protein NC99_30830 [Sunxiuqinia dokdonensis]
MLVVFYLQRWLYFRKDLVSARKILRDWSLDIGVLDDPVVGFWNPVFAGTAF